MKSYTDIEQSRKLKKILPLESADMHYIIMGDDEEPQTIVGLGEYIGILPTIPAWSLSALLSLMPFQYIENNNRFGFYQVKGFNKQGETYRFGYKTNNNSFLFETSWHNDIVDAAFEMVCWLKENKKI